MVTSGKPSARSKRIWWPNTLQRAGAGAVGLLDPVVEDALEEVEVLAHARNVARPAAGVIRVETENR